MLGVDRFVQDIRWMKLEFSLLSSSITDRVELGEGSDSLVELAVVGGLDLFVSWFLV